MSRIKIENTRTMKTIYIPIHKLFDLSLAMLLLSTYVGEHFGFSITELGTTLIILHGFLHVIVFVSLMRHVFKGDDN